MPQIESQPSSTESASAETRTSTVLVVDDDHLSRKLVEKSLEREDIEFAGVASGEEAIEYLKDKRPDLILCDIIMPEMDGIEFCSYARLNPRLEELPIIMFTGLSSMESLSQAYEAGAYDYIIKPLRRVELISRVEHHIDEYRRKRETRRRIQKLNKQNESKTKFLGVASHDLRNPLVSIRGISQYLDSEKFGPLNEGQKEVVSTIIQASESMLTLVEDLMDVSMFESGQMRLSPELQSLENLVDHAVTLHSPNASKKRIQLEKVASGSDTHTTLDRKLVSRVIDNLISNAVKFSNPDTRIQLVLESDDSTVSLKVEDEGPGIPEDEFHALFKEFGRTSNLPTGGESSSGIGLFVCQRIMQRHEGDISDENRSKGGARFTITFKRELTDE